MPLEFYQMVLALMTMFMFAAAVIMVEDHLSRGVSVRVRSIGWRVGLGVVLLALLFGIVASATSAHDRERPDLTPWFMSLQGKKTGPCCDGTEAMHLANADWQTQDKPGSHYRVKVPVDGEAYARALKGEDVPTRWVDVSDDALVDEPNREGTALVWPMYLQWNNPSVRCFLPGTMT